MKNFIFNILLIITSISCSKHSEKVKQTLKIANGNRIEHKNVLEYYSQKPEDSIKLKAAYFLIENMQWHYGAKVIPSDNLWDLFLLEDSLINRMLQNPAYWKNDKALSGYKYSAKKMLIDKAIGNSTVNAEYQSDLLNLNADFIIEAIETAFQVKELDWCKNLLFEDFCEYILPYRLNNEPVYPIRKKLNDHLIKLYFTDSLHRKPNHVISFLNKYTKLFNWDWDEENRKMPDLGFYNIFYWHNKNLFCSHQVAILGQIMRSIGLPVVEVFTPKWRDTNLGHSWCAIPDSNGSLTLFSAFYQNPGEVYAPHSPAMATKFYMNTFASQTNSPFFLKAFDEDLPPSFNTPCIKDVTGHFVPVRDIEIGLMVEHPVNNLCWFSIFIQGNWVPVGWGNINKDENIAYFEDIPIGLTGIACYYDQGNTIPCSKLFTVTENELNFIEPDENKFSLLLTRKFPEKIRMQYFVKDIIGAKLQGANKPDFSDTVTLFTIKDTLRPYLQDITFKNTNRFQYWRLVAPSWGLHIAELEFVTENKVNGTVEASPLPVFGENEPPHKLFYKFTGKVVADDPDSTAFDGDMLTFNSKKWVGLDFGQPLKINSIRIAPRNANNGIVPGDNYQLFYWSNEWNSAGITEAQYNFVEFDNVPENTLYWLRNLDHGKEEQPFFYKNGKQIFSNQQ